MQKSEWSKGFIIMFPSFEIYFLDTTLSPHRLDGCCFVTAFSPAGYCRRLIIAVFHHHLRLLLLSALVGCWLLLLSMFYNAVAVAMLWIVAIFLTTGPCCNFFVATGWLLPLSLSSCYYCFVGTDWLLLLVDCCFLVILLCCGRCAIADGGAASIVATYQRFIANLIFFALWSPSPFICVVAHTLLLLLLSPPVDFTIQILLLWIKLSVADAVTAHCACVVTVTLTITAVTHDCLLLLLCSPLQRVAMKNS